jgi:hypothetical protein
MRCTAIKSSRGSGQQCQLRAMPGAERCRTHTPGATVHRDGCRCFSCVERRKREARP